MTVGKHVHPCPTPTAKRRRRNTLWICECGQAWVCRGECGYNGIYYVWYKWEPPITVTGGIRE